MKKTVSKLVLGLCVFAFSFIPVNAQLGKVFPDVSSDYWAARQIKDLSQAGVIVGYPDGMFKPNANVTRAEFASMAIRALGQEHTTVAQPVYFTDVTKDYWAYDSIQKALYFDLVSCPASGQPFRPDDNVSYAEAVSVAVNALTTESISVLKAKEVLSASYTNVGSVPEWFLIPAGKAEILNMNVKVPDRAKTIESTSPATRAQVVVLLDNMMREAKLNPNRKLADAMRKKTGEGFVVEGAFVQGSIGTIPAGAIIPVEISDAISSQTSKDAQAYLAKAPQNYITRDKYILIAQGADLKGQLIDVRPGKLFVRNGVLVLENESVTTVNDQTVAMHGVADIQVQKNWFIALLRKIFKGEKIGVGQSGTVYIKLLKPLKIDLTNGWILQ